MNKLSKYIYLLLVYFFIYFPIAVIILFSFNDATHSLLWQGFTTKWYLSVFNDNRLLSVTRNSVLLGVLSATFSTLLGIFTAISLFRYKFLGKKLLNALIFIMILTPEIVMGISLLLLYYFFKIPLGFWGLLVAHVTMCVPFAAVIIYSHLITFEQDVFEAAMDLGATEFIIFRKITIPLLCPAIIAAWLLSFTLSFDDVIISHFVCGPSFGLLPLSIYSMVRLGVKPQANALCAMLLLLTLIIAVFTYQVLLKKKTS